METIKKLVQTDLEKVDHYIQQRLEIESGLADQLSHHLLNSGGKRIRPLLVLLSSHACGYEGDLHLPLAAAVEFFHTATLLHDDVVDDSTLRRGKSTANHLWGNQASILVGDLLLTQSMMIVLESNQQKIQQLLCQTGYEITRGELKQLSNRHQIEPSMNDYFEVIRSKTALLFATAAAIGALLQDPASPFESALFEYGLHLGNAFQLIDDTLDYCADATTMGKNSGDDLADGKATLPLLYVLQHGNEIQKQLIQSSLKTGSLVHFMEIVETLESTGAIEYTRGIAHQEKELAIQALAPLPASPYKEALIELAGFAMERAY